MPRNPTGPLCIRVHIQVSTIEKAEKEKEKAQKEREKAEREKEEE